eukprot:CAMPEP_0118719848 /NCGR_PEP_ID=MMETSP0800-20121206/29752_1 /TAXON_ID=210618 ORGANISM="Striatella unipunctata, Strain CCMP2910" /NCGR_SAMPLE_ID=MMETSP0800 /ASSEMBLY_ACC=CAM_ASM_000638 /LENGTH=185 /DNA_ID=CAMNT_0006627361 /DNA_START=537 /DNA_END=1094 /DNA_ORIENTATION=+
MTGVAAAAYGIVMQMYTVGFVAHVAMQGAAAALVPSSLARSGRKEARVVADRLYLWSLLVGLFIGMAQYFSLPYLIPLFSTLPEVQEAVRVPSTIACIIHVINGPRFAGEGILLGLGCFRDLTLVTVMGISIMVSTLASPLGKGLEGIMWCNLIFCAYQAISLCGHYSFFGPLSQRKRDSHLKDG